jgi:hypothetical protein
MKSSGWLIKTALATIVGQWTCLGPINDKHPHAVTLAVAMTFVLPQPSALFQLSFCLTLLLCNLCCYLWMPACFPTAAEKKMKTIFSVTSSYRRIVFPLSWQVAILSIIK